MQIRVYQEEDEQAVIARNAGTSSGVICRIISAIAAITLVWD